MCVTHATICVRGAPVCKVCIVHTFYMYMFSRLGTQGSASHFLFVCVLCCCVYLLCCCLCLYMWGSGGSSFIAMNMFFHVTVCVESTEQQPKLIFHRMQLNSTLAHDRIVNGFLILRAFSCKSPCIEFHHTYIHYAHIHVPS